MHVDIDIEKDGEYLEIYVEGWFLCGVKKNDVSLEALQIICGKQQTKGDD